MRSTIVLLSLATVSCAKDRALVPAPAAEVVPGRGQGAVDRTDRVTVVVRAGAWEGAHGVTGVLEPLRVSIGNESGHPLRIRYEDLSLWTDTQRSYAALPPYDVRGSSSEDRGEMAVAPSDFYVAADAQRFFPSLAPWTGPWEANPEYWDTWYPVMSRTRVPAGEVLHEALPEGVLENGGKIAGYVYFQKLDPEVQRVEFRFSLVDAKTGARFGTSTIPFRLVKESEAVSEADPPSLGGGAPAFDP